MTTEEQAAFDGLEIQLAISNALPAAHWIDQHDARSALHAIAIKQDGRVQFRIGENEDKTPKLVDGFQAAQHIAANKKHWVKAQVQQGTGISGNVNTQQLPPAMSYYELLMTENSEALLSMMTTQPKEFARLRDAHFKGK